MSKGWGLRRKGRHNGVREGGKNNGGRWHDRGRQEGVKTRCRDEGGGKEAEGVGTDEVATFQCSCRL